MIQKDVTRLTCLSYLCMHRKNLCTEPQRPSGVSSVHLNDCTYGFHAGVITIIGGTHQKTRHNEVLGNKKNPANAPRKHSTTHDETYQMRRKKCERPPHYFFPRVLGLFRTFHAHESGRNWSNMKTAASTQN